MLGTMRSRWPRWMPPGRDPWGRRRMPPQLSYIHIPFYNVNIPGCFQNRYETAAIMPIHSSCFQKRMNLFQRFFRFVCNCWRNYIVSFQTFLYVMQLPAILTMIILKQTRFGQFDVQQLNSDFCPNILHPVALSVLISSNISNRRCPVIPKE